MCFPIATYVSVLFMPDFCLFLPVFIKEDIYLVSIREISNLKKGLKSLFELELRARPRSKNLRGLRKCPKE